MHPCTINNPVKLCVAKAGSAATLSSFLTPYSRLSLPPSSLMPSLLSPSFFFYYFFFHLSLTPCQRGKISEKEAALSLCSRTVMLNVLLAPFTTFSVPMQSTQAGELCKHAEEKEIAKCLYESLSATVRAAASFLEAYKDGGQYCYLERPQSAGTRQRCR